MSVTDEIMSLPISDIAYILGKEAFEELKIQNPKDFDFNLLKAHVEIAAARLNHKQIEEIIAANEKEW